MLPMACRWSGFGRIIQQWIDKINAINICFPALALNTKSKNIKSGNSESLSSKDSSADSVLNDFRHLCVGSIRLTISRNVSCWWWLSLMSIIVILPCVIKYPVSYAYIGNIICIAVWTQNYFFKKEIDALLLAEDMKATIMYPCKGACWLKQWVVVL